MARSSEEEVVNAVTHFIASIASLLFGILSLTSDTINPTAGLALWVMCGCSTWAFFTSYLYHASPLETILRKRNRIVDKTGIYIMISGCGCSFSLIAHNPWFGSVYSVFILSINFFNFFKPY